MNSTGKTLVKCAGVTALGVALAVVAPTSGYAAAQRQPDPNRYIVKFKNPAQGKLAVQAHGARMLLDLGRQDAAAVHIPAGLLEVLRRNPNVEYIEQDPPRYPLAQTVPYGIPMVQADQVSDANAANRTVCIIDSGYYRDHEDLDSDSSVSGTNNSGTGNWYQDSCGHGTHVAGTISALNNSLGVVGVNRSGNLKLHIVKVFGDDCSWAYSSDLVNALNVCRNAGANVVSMSLGCSGNFCKSTTEQNAFNDAYAAGVLSIAAAGNDGSTKYSYPASYSSVVSVAAIDSTKTVADFSQKNDQVELAAPGVGVLSSTPWLSENSLTADGITWIGGAIDGAASTDGTTAALYGVSGDKCGSTNANYNGKVVLCQRGDFTFADKVKNVQDSGGKAAVVYNNVASDSSCGDYAGTLNGTSTIPAITLSCQAGADALGHAGSSSTVKSKTTKPASGYEAWSGTSMATPHVSGVAALVWSHNTAWSNADVRGALQQTAQDLGAAGKDNSYGYGLIQAKAALDLLQGGSSCTITENPEASCSDGKDNDCDGFVDGDDTDCQGGSCLAKSSSCTSNSECCSGSCKGKPGAKTCK